MGTNYYLHEKPSCPHCARPFDSIHIGKSSGGWCFSLHVIPEDGINSLDDWRERWGRPGRRIVSEYGDQVSIAEMEDIITNRSWEHAPSQRDPEFLRRNEAEPGPRGLLRHRVGPYCVGHGDGTWDLITGYFS